MPRHGADDRLGEGAGLAGDADQHGRLGVHHHVEQTDLARLLERPAGDGVPALHEGRLRPA